MTYIVLFYRERSLQPTSLRTRTSSIIAEVTEFFEVVILRIVGLIERFLLIVPVH